MENSLGLYIVGGFLFVNLLLGLWAGRGVKDIRDYAVGNQRWGVGYKILLIHRSITNHFSIQKG